MTLLVEHPGHPSQLVHGRKGSVAQGVGMHGGGSYTAGGASLTTGSVVAIPGHAMAVDGARFDSDASYRKAALRDWQSKNAGQKFGVWDSRSEGGKDIVFDRIEHITGPGHRAKAAKLGRERGEDGIFDIEKGEYVPTGGKTYTEAEVSAMVGKLLVAFDVAPDKDASDDEIDAWAETVGAAIVAARQELTEGELAERAYVRDRRGKFAPTGGPGTGGPRLDSSERNKVGGAYTAERTALHNSIIGQSQAGIPAHPGEQVVVFTGGGAASGKSTMLKNQLEPNGLTPGKGDYVNVNADNVKTGMKDNGAGHEVDGLPDYQANVAAGKPYAAWDSHEESSDVSKRLMAESTISGRHVVYDSVGDNGATKVGAKVAQARANGAVRVDAHYATVNPETAVLRAKARSQDPSSDSYGRKVEEAEIRRQHADVSTTWHDLATNGTFDTLSLWDNNGPIGSTTLIATASKGVIDVKDQSAFDAFLSYATP